MFILPSNQSFSWLINLIYQIETQQGSNIYALLQITTCSVNPLPSPMIHLQYEIFLIYVALLQTWVLTNPYSSSLKHFTLQYSCLSYGTKSELRQPLRSCR